MSGTTQATRRFLFVRSDDSEDPDAGTNVAVVLTTAVRVAYGRAVSQNEVRQDGEKHGEHHHGKHFKKTLVSRQEAAAGPKHLNSKKTSIGLRHSVEMVLAVVM